MIFIMLGICCILQMSNGAGFFFSFFLSSPRWRKLRPAEKSVWVRWRSGFYSRRDSSETPRSGLIRMSCKQHAHIHYSVLINHLNRRHSTVSQLICGPGLDVNIKSWEQGNEQRGALICVILPPDVSIKTRGDLLFIIQPKPHNTVCRNYPVVSP